MDKHFEELKKGCQCFIEEVGNGRDVCCGLIINNKVELCERCQGKWEEAKFQTELRIKELEEEVEFIENMHFECLDLVTKERRYLVFQHLEELTKKINELNNQVNRTGGKK